MHKLRLLAAALAASAAFSAQAAPVQYAGNGHWYEYISRAVTAPDAFTLAAAASFNSMQGYLVTVTSQGENDFVASLAQGQLAWLGGSDAGAAVNDWTWRSGPEAGQAFGFTQWGPGEPNDCCGGENFVHINWGALGNWNDHGGPANPGQINGFVIEYSAAPTGVPEPGSMALLALGLAGVGLVRRRG